MKKALVIILATFFIVGCGSKAKMRALSGNVTALEEEVIELQESVAALSKLSRELTERTVDNTRRLDNITGVSTPTRNTVREVVPLMPVPVPEPTPPPTTQSGPRIIIIEDDKVMPKSLYDYALGLYNQKKFTESKDKFTEFLSRFPGDALAANAQYWKGETHYSLKDYRAALDAFLAVPSGYPQSNKVPDALLKAAYSHNLLGERGEAISMLTGIVRTYPDSKAATLAASTLARWQ